MAAGSGTQQSALTHQQKTRVEEFSLEDILFQCPRYNEELNANSISQAGPRHPADWDPATAAWLPGKWP